MIIIEIVCSVVSRSVGYVILIFLLWSNDIKYRVFMKVVGIVCLWYVRGVCVVIGRGIGYEVESVVYANFVEVF